MAIPLKKLKEGCCDSSLHSFSITNGDELDNVYATCDKIIECSDRYILIEEKSILLGFFDSCCIERGESLEEYKYFNGEVEYLKITELITLVQSMDNSIKKLLLAQTITNLMFSSAKKISNTTNLLCKQDDSDKTNGILTFYLYCSSGHPIDNILYAWLSEYKKNIFFECQDLKQKLEEEC
ncbi:MAG: hypothetical protein QM493_10560 [Sulfurovum sp.]